jgi:hypothetical protein
MPAFTRQHYIEVGRILNGVRDRHERQRLAEEFAAMFRRDNPRFDVDRFSSAVYGEGAREARRPPPRGRRPHRARAATTAGEYQGWPNWETWNVALWFGNDEGLYHAVLDHHGKFTATSAKRFVLDLLPNGTPDFESSDQGYPYHYSRVRWREIAESFNELRSG